jgi:hypothetical protein
MVPVAQPNYDQRLDLFFLESPTPLTAAPAQKRNTSRTTPESSTSKE